MTVFPLTWLAAICWSYPGGQRVSKTWTPNTSHLK